MVTVISSEQALWDEPRPEFEDTTTYIAALKEALSRGDATRVSAHYAFIVTRGAELQE